MLKYLSVSELSEQLHFVSQALYAMATTKLDEHGRGITSFPAVPRRDVLALKSICHELCKFGAIDDVQVQQNKICFRAGSNRTQINLSDFWNRSAS